MHGRYHDAEYGFPTRDEIVLFDVDRVAAFGPHDIERLLGDPDIIRNRRRRRRGRAIGFDGDREGLLDKRKRGILALGAKGNAEGDR